MESPTCASKTTTVDAAEASTLRDFHRGEQRPVFFAPCAAEQATCRNNLPSGVFSACHPKWLGLRLPLRSAAAAPSSSLLLLLLLLLSLQHYRSGCSADTATTAAVISDAKFRMPNEEDYACCPHSRLFVFLLCLAFSAARSASFTESPLKTLNPI